MNNNRGIIIQPENIHEEESITPGKPPEGLEGTVGEEFWKSGLCGPKGKPDIRVSFNYYEQKGLGWKLKIELWRKDGKYWEDRKAFVYPIPQSADDLTDCILDATKQVRLHAPLPAPNRRAVTPPVPGSLDRAAEQAFKNRGTGRG